MPTHQSQTRLCADLDTTQKKNDGATKEMREARGEESLRKYIGFKPADDEPRVGVAWYWLGMIQEMQGKKAEAKQSYLMAQKLAPDLNEATEALKRMP